MNPVVKTRIINLLEILTFFCLRRMLPRMGFVQGVMQAIGNRLRIRLIHFDAVSAGDLFRSWTLTNGIAVSQGLIARVRSQWGRLHG